MSEIAANTPVIIGLGFTQEKSDNPLDCHEAVDLMEIAVRNSAGNAGSDCLLTQLDAIAVQQGSWQYPNPGHLLANRLGSPGAQTILAALGVLQITPLFNLCNAIANGEQSLGVCVGGESRFRDLRSMITGQPVDITEQPENTPAPDIHHQIPDPFSSDLEAERGVWAPGEFYAIADSALRHAQGFELNDYRDHIAQMYSEFSEVAANNPHAWRQEKLSPGDIRTVTDKNGMIAFPYTKNHHSQWNVNQAVAVMVCSYGKAKELGLDDSGWIYPLAAVQSRNVVALAQKPQLHTHHGSRLSGERAFALAGLSPEDVEVADMYSCFPVAIQAYASDLKLPASLPLSVTGSMAYGGGPFNHGGLDSTARMAEVLREKSSGQHVGLITNLSGMFGKQGCLLLGTEPNRSGFGFDDITEQVAALEQPIPLNGDYEGPATIVGYSVMFNKGVLSHAIAYCDTPGGERTVVRSENEEVLLMTETEYVGKTVQVSVDGGFSL